MRICVGKSANPERVLPSMAMETVGETVLPAAVEAVGMAETIDEKAVSGKSGRKKPENMLEALQCFLTARYDFRYNLLTEQTEYRGKEMPDEEYGIVTQRDLNTFCLEARTGGINCWDKDVSRLLHSERLEDYHPFLTYMDISLLFKIAAIGILVAVLYQVLVRAGREDQAMMTTLAGLVIVLTLVIKEISTLFTTVRTMFGL